MGLDTFFGHFDGSHEQRPNSIVLSWKGQGETPQTEVTLKGIMMSKSQPSLPTNRAFVVQFRAQSPGASSSYAGRIEHIVSGEATRFQSLEELLAFMVRVLVHVQQESDAQ